MQFARKWRTMRCAGSVRALTVKDAVGICCVRHFQFNAPNNQFTLLKLKYSRTF